MTRTRALVLLGFLALLYLSFWLGTSRVASRTNDQIEPSGRAYLARDSTLIVLHNKMLYFLHPFPRRVQAVSAVHAFEFLGNLFIFGDYPTIPEGIAPNEDWKADLSLQRDQTLFRDIGEVPVAIHFARD